MTDYVDAMNETHGRSTVKQLVCADCDHSEVMLILSLLSLLLLLLPLLSLSLSVLAMAFHYFF